jgi:hypothetical protein
MQSSGAPSKFALPFAADAGGSYIRTIPLTTSDPTAASLTLGWPPETFIAIASGGALPDGRDMNGIMFESTAAIQWQQAGNFYQYDAVFSGAIGGYPKNAILSKASLNGLWISTVENNTSDPDTGGAGWASFILSTAYQYDVPILNPYGPYPARAVTVFDTPTTQFQKSFNQAAFWGIDITNNIDLTLPIKIQISFTSNVANNNFYMQFQYQNITTSGLAVSYTTLNETLTAPSTANNEVNYVTTTAVIPASALTYPGTINCILTRLSNNVLDTNSGNLQIINVRMQQ